jgi:hypothetical protein
MGIFLVAQVFVKGKEEDMMKPTTMVRVLGLGTPTLSNRMFPSGK